MSTSAAPYRSNAAPIDRRAPYRRSRTGIPIETALSYRALVGLVCLKLLVSVGVGDRPAATAVPLPSFMLVVVPELIDGLLAAVLSLFFVTHPAWTRRYTKVFLFIGALGALTAVSTYANDVGAVSGFTSFAKLTLPVLIFVMASIVHDRDRELFRKGCWAVALTVAGLTAIGLVLLPADVNRGREWLPAYFSGLHTSAYTLLAGFLLALSLSSPSQAELRPRWLALGTAVFAMVTFGWGVRTSTLAFLVFGFCHGYRTVTHWRSRFLFGAAFAGSLFLAWLPFQSFELTMDDLNDYASGRIGVYAYKLEELRYATPFELAVGRGYGSDLAVTDTWWWGEKDSHNDYLKLLVENGVPFLALFLVMLYTLARPFRRNSLYVAIWLAYLASSMISNGYMSRPLPSYVLALALVAALDRSGSPAVPQPSGRRALRGRGPLPGSPLR